MLQANEKARDLESPEYTEHTKIGETTEGEDIFQSWEDPESIYVFDHRNHEVEDEEHKYFQKKFEFKLDVFGTTFICDEHNEFSEMMHDIATQIDEKEGFLIKVSYEEFWCMVWEEVKRSLKITYPELDTTYLTSAFEY